LTELRVICNCRRTEKADGEPLNIIPIPWNDTRKFGTILLEWVITNVRNTELQTLLYIVQFFHECMIGRILGGFQAVRMVNYK